MSLKINPVNDTVTIIIGRTEIVFDIPATYSTKMRIEFIRMMMDMMES